VVQTCCQHGHRASVLLFTKSSAIHQPAFCRQPPPPPKSISKQSRKEPECPLLSKTDQTNAKNAVCPSSGGPQPLPNKWELQATKPIHSATNNLLPAQYLPQPVLQPSVVQTCCQQGHGASVLLFTNSIAIHQPAVPSGLIYDIKYASPCRRPEAWA
jgi:hypothetical protein